MKNILWVDLAFYSMRLFMARDKTGKHKHRLVVTGPGIESNKAALEGLGFNRDQRFADKNYWTRTAEINNQTILRAFPDAVLVSTPADKIMPALAAEIRARQQVKIQSVSQEVNTNGQPQFQSVAAIPGSTDVAGVGTDAVLGTDSSRDDAVVEPGNDVVIGQVGGTEVVSDAPAGNPDVGGSPLGGGLEEEKSSGDDDDLLRVNPTEPASEGGSERDSLEGYQQEHVPAGSSELIVSDSTPNLVHGWDDDDEAVEVTFEREWRGLARQELLDAVSDKWRLDTPTTFASVIAAETGGLKSLAYTGQLALLAFNGWGGAASKLKVDNKKEWENKDGKAVAGHLGMSLNEYQSFLSLNRLESYYTHPSLIDSLWAGVVRLGVKPSSKIFEPGSGTARFIVGAPSSFHKHATFVGVETDAAAVRIAKLVAPDAHFINKPLERTALPRDFDAVIGNVPFGESRISDPNYPNASHIHDYFIVRSLDQLKVGGVMAVITSSGTMDKADGGVRQQIMDRANLVGAFRLPKTAFFNQGTTVITDVLVFQRRPEGTVADFDFTSTSSIMVDDEAGQSCEFRINQYFKDNPQNIIGLPTVANSAFGPKLSVSFAGGIQAIADQLQVRMSTVLPEGLAGRTEWLMSDGLAGQIAPSSEAPSIENSIALDAYEGFVGDFAVVNGEILEVVDLVNQFSEEGMHIGQRYLAAPVELSAAKRKVIADYIDLRTAARELMQAQVSGTDDELSATQGAALARYESFVGKFGPVNSSKNLRVYGDDAGSAEVTALEIWDDENEVVISLADAFTNRVVGGQTIPKVENSEDSFYVCLDRLGKLDIAYMSEISGISQEKILDDLMGVHIFRDPATGGLLQGNDYLSGNVVRKLSEARQIAEVDGSFRINVEALLAVQPATIPFEDIHIRLGSSWIPTSDVVEFSAAYLGCRLAPGDMLIRYEPKLSLWSVAVSSAFKRDNEAKRRTVFGTSNASFEVLLEKLLNNQRPVHTIKVDGKTFTDEVATQASRQKQEDIADGFNAWVLSDSVRMEKYAHMYNESTNVFVVPKSDGSRLTFPGLALAWNPRSHQSDMVAKGLFGYNTMAAHPVGAGKTFEMVAMAMKFRQVGKHKKPAIAVPNHMLGQIAREAKQMYPAAKILMVNAEDLKGSNRKRFLAIARNNDWDIVVMTHGMLNSISAPADVVAMEFDKKIDLIGIKIDEEDSDRIKRRLVAELKTAMSQKQAVLAQMADDEKRGGALSIDKLGIDCLMVDEAHLYKNLELNSAINALGVTVGGSQRAFNLYSISSYMQKIHAKPAGMHFFTGTAIANSMCEMYVHNKILRPDILEDIGIYHFDEWANRFGDVVSTLEALPEGSGFRVNERFARFVNLPEMIKLFRTFADVRTKGQLNLPTPTVHTHVIAVDQSDWQKAFMKHLTLRATAVRAGKVDPAEDNILSIATAGRKASLDMRLIEPTLPSDSSVKLDTVAMNVLKVYEATSGVKGTQLIFSDLGTPGSNKPFSAYEEIKRLLIDKGVPVNEIAFIHDAKTNDAKESLFSKFRAGDVRVLLGSTSKMGVGTNVQERLAALHNVDCPWRPADIAQRLGRIDRQGNLFFDEVSEYRYTTKDSFDLFMWETNKRKAEFISQAMVDPDSAGRDVREEVDMGYAEVMSVTTGDPLIKEKVELDDRVLKMGKKQQSWMVDRANKGSAIRHYEWEIANAQKSLGLESKIFHALPKSRIKAATVSGSISGIQDGPTTWLYATDLGEAMLSRLPYQQATMQKNNEQEMSIGVSVGDIEFSLQYLHTSHLFRICASVAGERIQDAIFSVSKNAQVLGRCVREIYDVSSRSAKLQKTIELAQRNIEAIGILDFTAVWPQRDELSELVARKRELDAHFAKASAAATTITFDPFMLMLAEHLSDIEVMATGAEDELEAVDILDIQVDDFSHAEPVSHEQRLVARSAGLSR